MFECYLDGLCVRTFDNEADAQNWCKLYDGDHSVTYEFVSEN